MNTKNGKCLKNNILVCGDIHGNTKNILDLINIAKQNNCSSLIVLGDFGCYHNIPKFVLFMKAASDCSILNNIPIHFIKGNHENHDELKEYTQVTEVEANIFYHPNMDVFKIGKITFLSVGGANSVDKAFCKIGYDWFPNELITVEDYIRCENIKNVDVILSHDCPIGVFLDGHLRNFCQGILTINNRKLLQDIVDEIKPKLLIHGHYHIKYKDFSIGKNTIPVVGLGYNENINEQWMILDSSISIESQL